MGVTIAMKNGSVYEYSHVIGVSYDDEYLTVALVSEFDDMPRCWKHVTVDIKSVTVTP